MLCPRFDYRWQEPRYYSLVLERFLVPPCINIGDIAVAMARFPNPSVDNAASS